MTNPTSPYRVLPLHHYRAVVFDLFGTLVDAPTVEQRQQAAAEVGAAVDADPLAVDAVFLDSWPERHHTLGTVGALARYLLDRLALDAQLIDVLTVLLRDQGRRQIRADPTVVATLRAFSQAPLRMGLLSDASADVAEAWPASELASCVDVAVFSCVAGVVKPAASLYSAVLDRLGVEPQHVLYVGDGGGDELRGAAAAGLTAMRVERRGGKDGLVFGDFSWSGPSIRSVEDLAHQGGR